MQHTRKDIDPLFEVSNLSFSVGGHHILSDVSLKLRSQSVVALIGPNGAGKSSLLNCTFGLYPYQKGQFFYKGELIADQRPQMLLKKRICRSFQHGQLPADQSVEDILMLGRFLFSQFSWIKGFFPYNQNKKNEIENTRVVHQIMEKMDLMTYRRESFGELPLGLQRRVELGRVLAQEPELLFLDEPFTGMGRQDKVVLCQYLKNIIAEKSLTLCFIEHDVKTVSTLASHTYVLNFGKVLKYGETDEVLKDPQVIKAYLGEEVST